MHRATIEFGIPGGDVPKGAAPEDLVRRITDEISAFQALIHDTRVTVSGPQKKPVPEGAAGFTELVTWGMDFYFRHPEQIKAALILLPQLLKGISVATSYVMAVTKKGQEEKGKQFVTVKIADHEISLPTTSESIDEFIAKLDKELTPSEKKQ